MEQLTDNIILIVSELEFRVNREALTDASPYFRAMFEGHFVEAGLDRVELKDVCDSTAFSVLLDYIQNKRINLESNVDWSSVLALSDMFAVDTFAETLKEQTFQNWSKIETVSSISKLADTLDFRDSLFSHIFDILKESFLEKGKKIGLPKPSHFTETEGGCFSVIEKSPSMVVDLCGIEGTRFYRAPVSRTDCICFMHGLVSWVIEHKLNETNIRDVVRCIGIENMCEEYVMVVINKQAKTEQTDFLQNQLSFYMEDVRNSLRNSVSNLLVGWQGILSGLYDFYHFNFQAWTWDSVKLETMHTDTNNSSSSEVIVSNWYTKYNGFASDNYLTDNCNGICYSSAQYLDDDCHYQLVIFEFDNEKRTFTVIFKSETEDKIEGCNLCRIDDVLHGFAVIMDEDITHTIVHFTLHRNSDDNTWFNPEFELNPILSYVSMVPLPVATTPTEKGCLLLLLLHDGQTKHLWITEFNLGSGSLEPLGRFPKLPDIEHGASEPPDEVELEDITSKKIFTVCNACCKDADEIMFNFSGTTGAKQDLITSPFLLNCGFCDRNENHMPRIVRVINVCATV